MSYVRGSCGRKTPYEKKYSRKGQEQEEWALEKAAFDTAAQEVSAVDSILEQLEARSAEGRALGLRNLVRTLRERTYDEEQLGASARVLTDAVLGRVRVGAGAEAVLALDALEVLALALGGDAALLARAQPRVEAVALTPAPAALPPEQQAVVAAAVRALGTLAFFCGDDADAVAATVAHLDALVAVEPRAAAQPVVAAALGAWELVHTATGGGDYDTAYFTQCAQAAWAHLASERATCDTRMAAARALALVFARVAEAGDTVADLRDAWPVAPERFRDVFEECAYGAEHARADRAREQPLFRALAAWMLEGEELPAESLTLRGGRVVFASWAILARLNTCRRVLGPGLLAHLCENPLLPDVLQYVVPEDRKQHTSKQQKRLQRSPCSAAAKAQTQQRAKSRDQASFSFSDDF